MATTVAVADGQGLAISPAPATTTGSDDYCQQSLDEFGPAAWSDGDVASAAAEFMSSRAARRGGYCDGQSARDERPETQCKECQTDTMCISIRASAGSRRKSSDDDDHDGGGDENSADNGHRRSSCGQESR